MKSNAYSPEAIRSAAYRNVDQCDRRRQTKEPEQEGEPRASSFVGYNHTSPMDNELSQGRHKGN